MNENSGKKRREWVKNAAIIFLSVMLVLTFFSNTFMNYSLPEVAAQYVQSGTITAKIRGTGTVESGDPYNVKITETRTISSVLVKTGDKVEKGAPLLLLEDKESKEYIVTDSDIRIIDIILNPVKPELWLDPSIDDFYKFDNSKDMKHAKVKNYKHMGKLPFKVTQ